MLTAPPAALRRPEPYLRRQGNDHQGDGRFRAQIEAVVGQGVNHGVGKIFRRIHTEKDSAGEEGKKVSSQNAGNVALDQSVF